MYIQYLVKGNIHFKTLRCSYSFQYKHIASNKYQKVICKVKKNHNPEATDITSYYKELENILKASHSANCPSLVYSSLAGSAGNTYWEAKCISEALPAMEFLQNQRQAKNRNTQVMRRKVLNQFLITELQPCFNSKITQDRVIHVYKVTFRSYASIKLHF